jgi:plasmid stabilization system protein ParE
MLFRFSDLASAELAEAVRWYEHREPGLGDRFLQAVNSTIDLIQSHPDIGVPRASPLPSRQFLVHGFPYRVVYRVRRDDIYVIAVAHTSRRPDYWKERR